jgi:GT2 family glycosyltransferase
VNPNSQTPLVTVMVRSMQRDSLDNALASVAAQTDVAIEVVVVNARGGVHRELESRCGPFELRLVNQGGSPLDRPGAANLALDQAKGHWLLFLDDDDQIDGSHIARLRAALQARPDAVAAYTGVRLIGSEGQPSGVLDEPYDASRLWLANYLPIHAVLFSRAIVFSAGLRFDSDLPIYEDWDFWLQLSRFGAFVHLPGVSASYHLVGDSGLSADASVQVAHVGRIRIYAKWLKHLDGDSLNRVTTAAELNRIGMVNLGAELHQQKQHAEALQNALVEQRDLAARQLAAAEQEQRRLAAAELERRQLADSLKRQLDEERAAHVAAAAALQADRDALARQMDRAQALAAQQQQLNFEIIHSISWRMTAPLRELRAICTLSGMGRLLRRTRFLLPATVRQALKLRLATGGALGQTVLRAATAPAAAPPPGAVSGAVAPPLDKEAVRAAAEAALSDFLAGAEPLHLHVVTATGRPAVSVIVVLYNQAGLSLLCLQALSQSVGVDFETIIVDNASSDRVPSLLDRITGALVLRQDDNLGFLRAVNLAAARATGEHLLLLNNDAVVEPATLAHAVARLRAEPDAGAVGGPILLWDGRLQEAGSIIWRDGSCLGYGRGDSPDAPAYRFVRDVDYCSGAFLMIRRALFEQLGRFDDDFAPAYYEESDLCVRLWESGHRVVYDPAVRVKHFEFASDSGSGQAMALQARNRERFRAKHVRYLAGRPVSDPDALLQARSILAPGVCRVLIIDDRVPLPALGRGYPRAAEMAAAISALGASVTYYPLQFADCPWDDVYGALDVRTEVILGEGIAGLANFLQLRVGCFDLVLVSRPHNMQIVDALRERQPQSLAGVRMVYDAEALFALREIERAKARGLALSPAQGQGLLKQELDMARRADRVVAVSEDEARQFRQAGCRDVVVLGHALSLQVSQAAFASRSGFLFVGAITQDDCPNGDSVLWFAREVWPLIQHALGGAARLDVVGVCESEAVRALASPSIHIHGRVDDLAPFFERARTFVVPTRYAAGVPHKAHEAASRGLPMVVSPLIARQLGWTDEVLVGADGPAFAQACLRLHGEPQLWSHLREGLLHAVERDCSKAAFDRAVQEIMR